MRRLGGAVAVLAVLGAVVVSVPRAAGAPTRDAADAACDTQHMPYTGVPGARLVPTTEVSKDPTPVRYVFWRGTVPSFDGLPLSVDVTVPCTNRHPLPTVTMAHGFTDDKTVWEETGKSDTALSKDRPGSNDRWNNVWFAGRGYAVVNYTARGWHDSCGPDTPGRTATAPAPQCAPFQYWIHLDDKRWEVRDLQWLTGGLVQSGVADPERLAVTGGSYGGAPAVMSALLDSHIVCGAVPQPAVLGPDPCAGHGNGELVPWTTPDGKQTLTWAAALPLYTFSDLLEVLAPNGRGTDGSKLAGQDLSHTDPFGVPLQSTVSGLLLAAQVYGSLAPPGSDPSSDILTSTNRLLAGNPFPQDDPQVVQGVREYREFKSPITIEPMGKVPIFWVGGSTDALFPALQPLQMLAHVKAADPRYPFKLFLGDLGHDYAAERQDEWDLAKTQMNRFLDHYLRPDRTPEAPTFDVGATITRCLDHDAPVKYVSASSWEALHPQETTFTSTERGHTSTDQQGPAALATDPISGATLGGYKGCRIMKPSEPDPTTATYEFPIRHGLTLLGGPVVSVHIHPTGNDVPLSVRVWDVAPGATQQGLVSRGTYRIDGGAGKDVVAHLQISVAGYRFPAGHTLKVEVSADDSPYFQKSNIPAEVDVSKLSISLPLFGRAPGTPAKPQGKPQQTGTGPAIVLGAGVLVVIVAGVVLVVRSRRRRSS